ncbi:MogA/MoaB family molybdenum cofactor biosynthesis protein [Bacillus kexueae]|uniref:MogA/MoaB family molybdenum cofactor biosynthesis protein n=1 Tax=Aeribacillus kexueae TaxID=2078952 RepID=UPI001FAFB06F|nr:MogA/MoaB family molybdenum cofactor biosynthesis protein [Bacillus kexueae]
MSVEEHKRQAKERLNIQVVTISDTRDVDTDKSGKLIVSLLEQEGYNVSDYSIVKDEPTLIRSAVLRGCESDEIDVVITNGGTGISKRDQTIEAIQTIVEKEMTGFGELFRYISYAEDIGPAAMLSRAFAGISMNTVIFSLPGSTGAVKLAMEKLILPEVRHIVHEVNK